MSPPSSSLQSGNTVVSQTDQSGDISDTVDIDSKSQRSQRLDFACDTAPSGLASENAYTTGVAEDCAAVSPQDDGIEITCRQSRFD